MLFSFENLHRQYLLCRRNKRNTLNALRFEARQEENLLALQEALMDRTYAPSRSVCFFVQRPKLREIFAADFRDRIVHHVLVDCLERIWEPVFIHDSYACRKNKGVHAGVQRLRGFLRRITHNGTRPAWYLQLDIHNYFMSIDKDVLFSLLVPEIQDADALWLARVLVYHDCTQDYLIKGDAGLLEKIPPHKTLFHAEAGKGLPIGNLNSQFFANVYLNSLDQFVKHTLQCRHYLRYCDDFVLLAEHPEVLREWREGIETFLRERLLLKLNPKRQRLRPVSDGVDWLGYIVRADYLLVRRRVVGHLESRLRMFRNHLVRERRSYRLYRFDRPVLDELAACLASYWGHFALADTYRLRQSLWARYPFLTQYFGDSATRAMPERKYDAPKGFGRVSAQYRYFRWRFAGDVLFFQVGRFIEFYHPGDAPVAQRLGLSPLSANRRGARWGFPLAHVGRHVRRLLREGACVVCVGETGRYLARVQERAAVCRFVPTGT